MTMTPIPNLHDAILLQVAIAWDETAEARVRFRDGPQRVVLVVNGMTLVNCPHQNPWGASVSVNEVRRGNAPMAGGDQIEIELQSGDVITLEGTTTEWLVERDE